MEVEKPDKRDTRKEVASPKQRKVDSKKKSRSRPRNVIVTRSPKKGAEAEPAPSNVVITPPVEAPKIVNPEPEKRPPVAVITPPVETKPDNSPGRIRVSSSPAGDIFIDKSPFGTTNDPSIRRKGIILGPGRYEITVKRRGFQDETQMVELAAKQELNLNFNLKKDLNQIKLKIQTNRFHRS